MKKTDSKKPHLTIAYNQDKKEKIELPDKGKDKEKEKAIVDELKDGINLFFDKVMKEDAIEVESALLVSVFKPKEPKENAKEDVQEEQTVSYMGFNLDESDIQLLINRIDFLINYNQFSKKG